MDLTERWLADIGGWQVLKAAQSILERGLVSDARRDDGSVRGVVTEGPKRYQSGLLIRTRTDVTNLCTCPTSRGRGLICAHSIAVALSLIRRSTIAPRSSAMRAGESAPPPSDQSAAPASPSISCHPPATAPSGRFTFFLPDNLLDGTFKGQAAVFMRHEPGNGTESDGRVTGWLRTQGLKPATTPLMLTRQELPKLLGALAGHHSVFSGKPSSSVMEEQRLTVAEVPVRLPVVVEDERDQIAFAPDSDTLRRIAGEWCFCSATRAFFAPPFLTAEARALIDDIFGSVANDRGAAATGRPHPAPAAPPSRRTTRSLAWLVRHRAALDEALQMRLVGVHLSALHLVPLPCEFELQLDGSMQVVEARLNVVFHHLRWPAMDGTADEVNDVRFPLEAADHVGRFFARNLERERAATGRLFDLGFEPVSSTTWRLQGPDKVARFYASDLPRLQRVFKIDESQRWRTATRGVMRITPRVAEPQADEQRESRDWLSLDIAYEAPDGFRITRGEVMQLIRTGRRGLKGKDGKQYLLDADACEEFEESLRDLDGELTTGGVRVRADKAQFLFATDDETFAARQAASWQSEAWLKEQLPDLAELLRPYQLDGIRWLEASARGARAGLLADDMGLGKTLQAIALIRLLRLSTSNSQPSTPALIVCPKSLIANWEREFERFAPSLKVMAIHGSDRQESFERLAGHDAIITTYQLVVRDLAQHRKRTYAAIVLDEASHIRNPDTEAAKALRVLKAEARFALTGTPVENGVRDLWSIFHFILPGYLGGRDSFKDRFEKTLANGLTTPEARKVSERLKKLVRPYFLRRTKKDVLKDLPEKIEQVLWCDLSRPQSEVYRRVLEEGLAEVRDARRRSGKQGVKMTMFTVLLRLRQVCCDLRMTGMNADVLARLGTEELSGKLGVWRDRLDEIITGGGKVIVFSQFVKFLHLLRDELSANKTAFCYLDGQSNDRAGQVARFQSDTDVRVFLISLKAGGYGLNLTAADHVMLMDPWWNPAVESQAIDRAHRLGQERVVTALRLVTRGTVEEKILKLQAQKRGLIEAALDDESPLMSGLTDADLEGVLEAAAQTP
ncbi:MAG: DEAD/DEAH box helicase [Verrucomicrobiaceae bacterium]|nr:DEAD/DEAH box helicase [Verrucomicrobiaceae bacterium]